MRFLIILLFISFSSFGQTITNKKGDVFDIRNVSEDALIDYSSWVQGIFVGRIIEVDTRPVFNFKKWKKVIIKIDGKVMQPEKNMMPVVLEFFRFYGYKIVDRDSQSNIIPCGSGKVCTRVTNRISFIKKD